jgi:hypothetical protein
MAVLWQSSHYRQPPSEVVSVVTKLLWDGSLKIVARGEKMMENKSNRDPKLHSFRRNLKWSWSDTKKELRSGTGVLGSLARMQLIALAIVILFAIAKFGFGWF